jgi:hypothetical protein
MRETTIKTGFNLYSGLFFTALSTLLFEILLTRIFSVTMGYHYAFLSVSIAMFGFTVGGITVYLKPDYFKYSFIYKRLALFSFLYSLSVIISFLLHVYIPFIPGFSVYGIIIIIFTCIIISIPFIFSGIVISLILTKFPEKVNRLYAVDLIGAALGCILIILFVQISGGPTTVFIVALLASISVLFFSGENGIKRTHLFYTIALFLFVIIHSFIYNAGNPLIRLQWIRGAYEEKPQYEKWNSFSRVNISGDTNTPVVPFGWGLSNTYDRNKKVKELMLNVDANSTTVLTGFDGDLSKLEHLKYDISNLCQQLRTNSDVLVIGSGGGRDILTSLLFRQKSVLGIEMNGEMIDAMNGKFGNFTGHLDKYPNVNFLHDEARSYIQRSNDKYDIIQVSVVDNWAATSSGAFVLTESSIYTLEAWKLFIQRLKPGGLLTVTRFWMKNSAEIYRIASIFSSALLENGIAEPRNHILIIRSKPNDKNREDYFNGVANVIASNQPFSVTDLQKVDNLCRNLQFDVFLSPDICIDSTFANITKGEQSKEFIKNFPVNITPPTDDKPYFFHLLKFTDLPDKSFWKEWDLAFNAKALLILWSLIGVMIVLTLTCIVVPLKFSSFKVSLKDNINLFFYFGAIGFGFMLIEISQIQRLGVFLGHPTYSLSVSLFTILLSTGTGSFFSSKFKDKKLKSSFLYILISLFVLGLITPAVSSLFRETTTLIRIIVSVSLLFPLGFFLGFAFPFGMKMASVRSERITPWLWGINGVTSVFASVLAIVISMSFGISYTYWIGTGFYLIAFLSMLRVNSIIEVN